MATQHVIRTCDHCGGVLTARQTSHCSRKCYYARAPRPLDTRFWRGVKIKTNGCWIWLGSAVNGGYGDVYDRGRHVRAHRWTYETLIGPIPTGLELDHLCRTPSCVNPTHLEAVTHAENVRRGTGACAVHAQKTHCLRGHIFDDANTYRDRHGRRCRTCAKEYEQRRDRPHR